MERFDIDKVIKILGLDVRADEADGGSDFDVACMIAFEKLKKCKKYEDLQEQGRLLELPCAVGDTVYTDGSSLTVREIHIQDNLVKYFVARFNPNGLDVRFAFNMIGKTVFLTREKAEAATSGSLPPKGGLFE